MTAQPQWDSVDDYTADLLTLVATGSPASPAADEEWDAWLCAARAVALSDPDGIIRPNELRPLVRDRVASQRSGAFTNRAVARNLIVATGDWEISNDRAGRNSGRPMRVYRWIGGNA